jgi:hypothetical protein
MNDIRFDVDFNDRDRDGRLKASRRFASSVRVPEPGETVWVADDEGNRCRGTVSQVEGLIVYIDLDRSTWRVPGPASTRVIEDKRSRIRATERPFVPQLA